MPKLLTRVCFKKVTSNKSALNISSNSCLCNVKPAGHGVLQDKDYAAAAQLAFELKQPGRLLAVVQKAYEAGPAKAHHILAALVKGLDQEQLKLSLEYIRDWNTNSRHCSAAQAMLQAILVQHQPEVYLPCAGVCTHTMLVFICHSKLHYLLQQLPKLCFQALWLSL